MPSPKGTGKIVEGYLGAVGTLEGKRYLLKAGELAWVLRKGREWDSTKLELYTALQKAFPQPRDEKKSTPGGAVTEEIKAALTNLIIMETRVGRQSEALLELLDKGMKEGVVKSAVVDLKTLNRWALSALEAGNHVAVPSGSG